MHGNPQCGYTRGSFHVGEPLSLVLWGYLVAKEFKLRSNLLRYRPLTASPSPNGRGWPKRRRSRRPGEGSVADRIALLGSLRLLATS